MHTEIVKVFMVSFMIDHGRLKGNRCSGGWKKEQNNWIQSLIKKIKKKETDTKYCVYPGQLVEQLTIWKSWTHAVGKNYVSLTVGMGWHTKYLYKEVLN